jgi:hypothetical protein
MKSNELRKKRPCLRYCICIVLKKPKKTSEVLDKIYSCWIEIWIQDILSTKQECNAVSLTSHTAGWRSQQTLCKCKAAPLCTCDVPFRALMSSLRLWATYETFRSGRDSSVLQWPNGQAPSRKGHQHKMPNTIFMLLLTPGNEQLLEQIPRLWQIEYSLGNRNFTRDVTPMVIKQVSAAVTCF